MGFSSQQYWSGLPCPPPGDLPDPGVKPESPKSPALAGRLFTTSATWEARFLLVMCFIHSNVYISIPSLGPNFVLVPLGGRPGGS